MMKHIYFRFNCGNMWGLGHLHRNITLMRELAERGHTCTAVVNDVPVAKRMLEAEGFPFFLVDEYETPEAICSGIAFGGTELAHSCLFFDRLDSTTEYMEYLRAKGLKTICYDNYHPSAFISTAVINTRKLPIAHRAVAHCGPQYQILRDDVRRLAARHKPIRETVARVLLHFGGTDPLNILKLSFDALQDFPDIAFSYVAGKGADKPALQWEIEALPNARYYRSVDNFPDMLYAADLCIISGGVTMYEAAAIGTPMIILSQNEDQSLAASIFEENINAIHLGIATEVCPDALRQSFIQLSRSAARRSQMSRRGKAFVDTNGVNRICDIIEQIQKIQ